MTHGEEPTARAGGETGGGGGGGGDGGGGERRSMTSLLAASRQRSAAKLSTPTLVVCDETNNQIAMRDVCAASAAPAAEATSGGTMAQLPAAAAVSTAAACAQPTAAQLPNQLSVTSNDRVIDTSHNKPPPVSKGTRNLTEVITSKSAQKVCAGVLVTVSVAVAWVSTTNIIKLTYYGHNETAMPNITNRLLGAFHQGEKYDAPFLTAWLLSVLLVLFYPIFCLLQCLRCTRKNSSATSTDSLIDCIRYFRDRGLSLGQFMWRTCLFSALWLLSTFMYVRSLRVLTCSDVTALLATSVAFVYLLSWVVLHEQFVGIRIVAVIMCNTGVALLAYMDGVTKSPTLGTVVMAATASATFAVFKVFYKKTMGEYAVGVSSLFFTLVALFSCLLMWPLLLILTLTGAEQLTWSAMPWLELSAAAGFWLIYNMLCIFAPMITYDIFVTLGMLLAIPACAALDIFLYKETYNGMRLSGMVLIFCGFILVLFPSDWPDYIRTVIRWGRRQHSGGHSGQGEPVDYRTGVISRSRLRSPSGHVR